jgi:hypothetical protein
MQSARPQHQAGEHRVIACSNKDSLVEGEIKGGADYSAPLYLVYLLTAMPLVSEDAGTDLLP